MKSLIIMLVIVLSGGLFGQSVYDYPLEKSSKLLLAKQIDGETKLIFQEREDNWIFHIYNFQDENNIELEKTVNLDELNNNWYRSVTVNGIDFVNETLYLAIYSSVKDKDNVLKHINSVVIVNDGNMREFEYYDDVEDIRMSNDKEGVFVKGDTVFVTWDNWEKIEKQVFDESIQELKIAYIGSLRDVILYEWDYFGNMVKFMQADFLNSSIDNRYSNPVDTLMYPSINLPYAITKTEGKEIYTSYEYSGKDSVGYFEIAKSKDNGASWEVLYESGLDSLKSYPYFDNRAWRISKMDIPGSQILAVNYENILYSNDSGATWKEYEHAFSLKERSNLFPKLIDGNAYVFAVEGVVKIDLSPNSVMESKLQIYPNPAKEKIAVKFDGGEFTSIGGIEIELINISTGKSYEINDFTIKSSNKNGGEIEFDIKRFISGGYIVKLKQGRRSEVKSFIIE